MVTSKRGRLSSADRERIHALAERGLSLSDIAKEVERKEEVIGEILGEKKSRLRKSSPLVAKSPVLRPSRPAPVVKDSSRPSRPQGLLGHSLWVRPGYQIELTLPADLTLAEAERLSIMIRSLPFS